MGIDGMTRIAINGVKDWALNLPESSHNEWVGNMKYHNNSWEMIRLRTLEKLIKEKSTKTKRPIVYYIGAYKGDMSALLCKMGADVINVESTPAFWSIIKETWDLNPDLPQPIANFSGLISDKNYNEKSGLTIGGWPTRQAEYIEGKVGFTHLAESEQDTTFPQITIDRIAELTNTLPDIVTMDIEGSELVAMYGGVNTLINHNASYVISVHPEFMFHNHGTYERELHDLMRNNKYNKYQWLDYDHEHHWLYEKEY